MPGIYSPLDGIIGVQSALGGRGGGLRYLLRDEFTTDRAAGAVNGTAAEPGPGTRVVNDVENKITISGGELYFTAPATPNWSGDEYLRYGAIAREAGRIMLAKWFRPSHSDQRLGFSYSTVPHGAGPGTFDAYLFGPVLTNTTNYEAAALRAAGYFTFSKSGSNWLLYSISSTSNTATLYPAFTYYSVIGSGHIDYIRVPVAKWLPTPLLSDGFGSAFGTSDGLGHAEGIAGGIGAGGSGVTLSNAGGTWSVSGGKAINTPSVGAEALTNGDFAAWTGDNPDGWTVTGEVGSDPMATEVGTGEGHAGAGTGSLNVYSSTSARVTVDGNVAWTTGAFVRIVVVHSLNVGSTVCVVRESGTTIFSLGAPATTTATWRVISNANPLRVFPQNIAHDVTIDSISVKALTLSELLTLSNLSCADVYAGVAITKSNTYVQAGLALNWDSASSPANGLLVYLSGDSIVVDKCVAGTWTEVSTTAYTYSAGARLVCTMNAGALKTYYNGVLVKADTIVDAGILTGTYHGLFSTDASNTLDDLTVYATGTGGEYSQLDSY